MSKIRSDEIVNKAGTGSPLFPNGIISGEGILLGTNEDPSKNIELVPDGSGGMQIKNGTGSVLTVPTNTLTRGTPVTLTNQTFVDFAIPAWAKRVTVMFAGVSTNGTSNIQLRVGTPSGIQTTGYANNAHQITGSAAASTTTNSGFVLGATAILAASIFGGTCVLTSFGDADIWAITGSIGNAANAQAYKCAGSKTLSSPLTTVRVTTVNGTDQFVAGTINVMWE